jgi:hypothetical protein
LAVDATGMLVSFVRFDGVWTAKAAFPCVRVAVDASVGAVAVLPVTLQLAGISKPMMAFGSKAVEAVWAVAPAISTNASAILFSTLPVNEFPKLVKMWIKPLIVCPLSLEIESALEHEFTRGVTINIGSFVVPVPMAGSRFRLQLHDLFR